MMQNFIKPLVALLAFSLIFVTALIVFAQFDMKELRKSEEYFKLQKEQRKQMIRRQDHQSNFSLYYHLTYSKGSEAQKAFGITEQQRKALTEIRFDERRDPEHAQVGKDYNQAISEVLRQYGEMRNAPQKDQIRIAELQNKMVFYHMKRADEYVQENLTPEQKQKFRELAISQMGKTKGPIIPDMLEALGLSGEQREKMKKIQKDLDPQYEQYLDKAVDWQIRLSNKTSEAMESKNLDVGSIHNLPEEERKEQMQKYHEEYAKINNLIVKEPEFRDAIKESNELRTAYSTALKFQMYDVLTDEQMNRLSELINNPPDYVKLAMDSDPQTSSETPSFLDSWKPGEPIPEEYKKHRENRRRFPQKK